MLELETQRLRLRELRSDDAAFIVELLNDAAFIRYIGDRGVRTEDQARDYIANGPGKSYVEFGFGLMLVQSKLDHKALACADSCNGTIFRIPISASHFCRSFVRKDFAAKLLAPCSTTRRACATIAHCGHRSTGQYGIAGAVAKTRLCRRSTIPTHG